MTQAEALVTWIERADVTQRATWVKLWDRLLRAPTPDPIPCVDLSAILARIDALERLVDAQLAWVTHELGQDILDLLLPDEPDPEDVPTWQEPSSQQG